MCSLRWNTWPRTSFSPLCVGGGGFILGKNSEQEESESESERALERERERERRERSLASSS
jgi:hypothetical protein